jgi:hypothetical protein
MGRSADYPGISLPSPPTRERGLSQFETFFAQSGLQSVADSLDTNSAHVSNANGNPNLTTHLSETGHITTRPYSPLNDSSMAGTDLAGDIWQAYRTKKPTFIPPSDQACQRYLQSFYLHSNPTLIHHTMNTKSLHFALLTAMYALGASHLLEYKNAVALFTASKSVALDMCTTRVPEEYAFIWQKLLP